MKLRLQSELSAVCFLLLLAANDVWGKLFPINPFPLTAGFEMFPNERLSLDDCHLRYHKYGRIGLVAPAFGEPAYLKEFAHMAAIGWTEGGRINWKCGGSLIWDNWILTAAHCAIDDANKEPDVARLGDINIYSNEDDMYAQQLAIVKVIRHPMHRFSASYYDVALLKLAAKVKLHPTVAPACLWRESDVPFPVMEATGWGDTGFAQDPTPILLKVRLRPVTNGECSKTYGSERKLRNGIVDHQLCAGDVKMDTCPGDSGGPLQMKLLHNGRITPFIVGVTSFGAACGTGSAGVYARVSSFHDWILDTLRKEENVESWRLEPVGCALRYAVLRDFEDDVVVSRSENFISLNSDLAHMTFGYDDIVHKVDIGFRNVPARGKANCSGILIADDAVLTLAECTTSAGVPASHITVDGMEEAVSEAITHPEYTTGSMYNNIAVLKLRNRIKFSRNAKPACIWHSFDIPSPQLQVAGVGRRDINDFAQYGEVDGLPLNSTIVNLMPRANVNTRQNCSIAPEFQQKLTRGLAREHLCVGNQLFLVPDSCELSYGATMQMPMWRAGRYFYYAYGLNLFGKNCGFGEAAVSTRLIAHIDWLKSVLLPSFRHRDSAVQFINVDLDEGDSCEYDNDTSVRAVCTNYQQCPKVWQDFQAGKVIHFCSEKRLICCPSMYVQTPRSRSGELDTCAMNYRSLHGTSNTVQGDKGLPQIITLRGRNSDGCLASLITNQVALTSASCVSSRSGGPSEAQLNDGSMVPIEKITPHPSYSNAEKKHDIALVKLGRQITPTDNVFPACLWMNLTHTPLNLKLINEADSSKTTHEVVPMYNTDCQRDYRAKIGLEQLCIDELDIGSYQTCHRPGDQLVWMGPDTLPLMPDTKMTPFLVGFYSFGENCQQGVPAVFTRVAVYVDWIRENL
ncbi:transmembrane protease serine 9-like [Uranotaenia lowii]|uniref:transmembrane protease serine 9-like n=1 Tax=Uranotaenia lowii TaxID=190385 RepID=UPI0024787962|nr:transmembrane protease serine 9-like [Uranotaenia lowii]